MISCLILSAPGTGGIILENPSSWKCSLTNWGLRRCFFPYIPRKHLPACGYACLFSLSWNNVRWHEKQCLLFKSLYTGVRGAHCLADKCHTMPALLVCKALLKVTVGCLKCSTKCNTNLCSMSGIRETRVMGIVKLTFKDFTNSIIIVWF